MTRVGVVLIVIAAGAALAQPTEEWVARYRGPIGWSPDEVANGIAIDSLSNVYVTGTSWNAEGGAAIATIKYSPAGIERWVARYTYQQDIAYAIAIDHSGNIYVTGSCVYAVGSTYETVKYDTAGVEQWVDRYHGSGANDPGSVTEARAIALDDSGHVYVTGWSRGSGTGSDYATVKYDPTGTREWVARYDGPGNGDDGANAIAIDRVGDIYVTGQSTGDGTDYDYATIKYSPAGVELWVNRYDGPGNGRDEATAIGVDPSGNIWVTGRSTAMGGRSDYATIKYTEEGAYLGLVRYTGQQHSYDVNFATALAIDSAGSIFVTGYSTGQGTDYDYATVKYDSALGRQWVVRYDGPTNGRDWPTAMATDDAGNAYVTGKSQGIGTGYDITTVKYTGSGSQEWEVRYDGSGNGDDRPTAVAVDAATNVYVAGSSRATRGTDYVTIKYNQGGGIAEAPSPRPVPLDLQITGPNPTRGAVTVRYTLPAGQSGVLSILDVTGRVVESHVLPAGGPCLSGSVPPGIYFVRLATAGQSATAKAVRLP